MHPLNEFFYPQNIHFLHYITIFFEETNKSTENHKITAFASCISFYCSFTHIQFLCILCKDLATVNKWLSVLEFTNHSKTQSYFSHNILTKICSRRHIPRNSFCFNLLNQAMQRKLMRMNNKETCVYYGIWI